MELFKGDGRKKTSTYLRTIMTMVSSESSPIIPCLISSVGLSLYLSPLRCSYLVPLVTNGFKLVFVIFIGFLIYKTSSFLDANHRNSHGSAVKKGLVVEAQTRR